MAREIWRIKAMFDDGPVDQSVSILQKTKETNVMANTKKPAIFFVCEVDGSHPIYRILACIYLTQLSLIRMQRVLYHRVRFLCC